MTVHHSRFFVSIVFWFVFAVSVHGQQPVHERSTPWTPKSENKIKKYAVVKLVIGWESTSSQDKHFAAFLLPYEDGKYVKLSDKEVDPKTLPNGHLPKNLRSRFESARNEINGLFLESEARVTTAFEQALTKEGGDTPFFKVPRELDHWNIQPWEGSNLLVVSALEDRTDGLFPHYLGFFSFHTVRQTLGENKKWHTYAPRKLHGGQPGKEPPLPPKSANPKSPDGPLDKTYYIVDTNPWEELWSRDQGREMDKIESAILVPKNGEKTKELLLVDKDHVRALALPRHDTIPDLVKMAFARGKFSDRLEITKELYEKLRLNAFFPLNPLMLPGNANLTWKDYSLLPPDTASPRSLILRLPVQWVSEDSKPSAADNGFAWRLRNSYQEQLFDTGKWRETPCRETAPKTVVEFGRRDPVLFTRSSSVQFSLESDPQDEKQYLPRGLTLWPPRDPQGAPRYYTEAATVRGDDGWRFCLVNAQGNSKLGGEKPAFYIQDREFTVRHAMVLWSEKDDLRDAKERLKRVNERIKDSAKDIFSTVRPALGPGDKPAQPANSESANVDSQARAQQIWEDVYWVTKRVESLDFLGNESVRLKMDAKNEGLFAARALLARVRAWQARKGQKLEAASLDDEKGYREWLQTRFEYEFAQLRCYFELRAIAWADLAASTASSTNPDSKGHAKSLFKNALMERWQNAHPETDYVHLKEQDQQELQNRWQAEAESRLEIPWRRYERMRLNFGKNIQSISPVANPMDWPLTGFSIDEFSRLIWEADVPDHRGHNFSLSEPSKSSFSTGDMKDWKISLPTVDQWKQAEAFANLKPGDEQAWVTDKLHAWPVRSFFDPERPLFRLEDRGREYRGRSDDPPIYNLFGNVSEFVADSRKDGLFYAMGDNYRERMPDIQRASGIPTSSSASCSAIGFRLVLELPPTEKPPQREPRTGPAMSPKLKDCDPIALWVKERNENQEEVLSKKPGAYEVLYGTGELPDIDPQKSVMKYRWEREQHFVHLYLGPARFWELEHLRTVIWFLDRDVETFADELSAAKLAPEKMDVGQLSRTLYGGSK